MPTPRILLAGCRLDPQAAVIDLYPDPDTDLLAAGLEATGAHVGRLTWDDPALDPASWDLVVTRSTWDGIDRPQEFLDWADAVERVSRLANPAAAIRWNLDKRYLQTLEAAGIPVVPTQWVLAESLAEAPMPPLDFPGRDLVIKPAVGAGARATAHYRSTSRDLALQHVQQMVDAGMTAMVQPHWPSVDKAGEISIIMVDGQISHAVRKGAFLVPDGPVPDQPWEAMVYLGACEPDTLHTNLARASHDAVTEAIGAQPTYARVDMIEDSDANPAVLEVELIDPYLSLGEVPGAVSILASALLGLVLP